MKLGVHLPTYYSWCHMLQRCTSQSHAKYPEYGGRGITVCDSWFNFDNFLVDMGEKPAGLTLDRKDNNAGYCKENCRWATGSEQQVNKRIESKVRPNNKTGIAGLYYSKRQSQWAVNFRNKHVGTFNDFFTACCARKSLEAKELA